MPLLRSKINYTTPCISYDKNANQNEMPLRRAVYEAIMQLRNTPNQNKYIILLVDSDITDYGDVLADGNPNKNWRNMNGCTQKYYPFGGPNNTWSDRDPIQDMSVFAQDSGVKIYVIYAASQLNECDRTTLTTLAESTGGAFNETQGDASKLASIYEWVASKIITEAAKDISMTINMGTLEVNGNWVTYDPNDPTNTSVFDYVYVENQSTLVRRYFESNSSEIFRTTLNQTDEYYADRILHFDIGTLLFDQIWEANYRLKALIAGNINIFGSNTTILFNSSDTIYSLTLPTDWEYVREVFTPARNETYDLKIDSFIVPATAKNYAVITWNLSYFDQNGTALDPNGVVTKLYYWDWDGRKVKLTTDENALSGSFRVPTSILPTGRVRFGIEAIAPRAPERSANGYTTINTQPPPKTPPPGDEGTVSVCIPGLPCIRLT
jgi:hypothetical protein